MPQVVLTGAPHGASSNTHECPSRCPSGCPRRCPRVPRSATGAALGIRVPCWALRAMPGGRREVEPGWGEIPPLGKERQKERNRPKKAPRRQPAGPRLLPKPKIPPQCLRAAGCPARLFGGSPLPPGSGVHPPRSYILLVRRILAFALPQPIHTASAPGPRAGAGPPPLCPPRAPWPRMTPPSPRLPPWCFTIFDYTIVRSHYR